MGIKAIKGTGWKRDVPDERDYKFSLPEGIRAMALPEKVDLSPLMPEVWDQGELGSCTANAIGAIMAYNNTKAKKRKYTPSRLFIYYNEREAEGTINEDSGAMLRTGLKTVNGLGVCLESMCPYKIAKFKNKPTGTAYKNGLLHKAVRYERLNQDLDTLKGCLASGEPFVFGFIVYSSFDNTGVNGIMPMPQPGEKEEGGHAICAVGYDDTDRTFLIRNSWGTEWGLKGHFKMPYDFVTDKNYCWDFWTVRSVTT